MSISEVSADVLDLNQTAEAVGNFGGAVNDAKADSNAKNADLKGYLNLI